MSSYFDNKQLFLAPTTTQHGSHMVMTDVSKETKLKLINIDTRFRDDYNYFTNDNNFVNISNITLPDKLTNVKSMKVLSAEIPMSYFNISAALGNNTFRLTRISLGANFQKQYVVTIDDGQYTNTTIQEWLNNYFKNFIFPSGSAELSDINYINLSGAGTTGSTLTSPNNNSLFETTNGNYYIEFCIDSKGDFDKYNLKSKLGWLLGFRLPSYIIYSGASFTPSPITLPNYITSTVAYSQFVSSESILDLNGPRYLYLVIDEFQNGNQNSFTSPLMSSIVSKNMIARITTDISVYPYGKVIPANLSNGLLTTDKRSYNGTVDIQRMKIQLTNEFGVPMNLNGYDFSVCLLLEYE